MIEKRTGAALTMVLLAAFLTGVGVWQFGSMSLGDIEHGDGDEHEYEERQTQYKNRYTPTVEIEEILNRISVEEDARIIEVEWEKERGRDLYEIKFVGSDGHVREIKVDAISGKLIGSD